ncbi:MAG: Sec-independent protein translocase protein TatB [Caldilinea sp.]|nr:Sec-independent protein translocase protein TatB [Caldilinea sp.]MDW8441124.1 Sec-independent protein translocase protein TatB [Caldilineaceae bacterium]
MDSFFGIGVMELFLIAIIALIVLGPERLPGAMRTIANFMRQLREMSNEFTSQFSEEIKMLEEMDPRRIVSDALDPSKTPPPAGSHSSKVSSSAAQNPTPPPAASPAKSSNTILPPSSDGAQTASPAGQKSRNGAPTSSTEHAATPPSAETGGDSSAEAEAKQ